MRNLAFGPAATRMELFQETANRTGLLPLIVEKDFWVCFVLHLLFEDDGWPDSLIFKGGTSLSKCFKVISRFSEDIDLILRVPGITEEEMVQERSSSQQKRFRSRIIEEAANFVRTEIHVALAARLPERSEIRLTDTQLPELHIEYPQSLAEDSYRAGAYMAPSIKLEIGPRGAWQPTCKRVVTPIAQEHFPLLFEGSPLSVTTSDVVQIFWEKMTLLHSHAHLPEELVSSLRLHRHSRHYHDLYMLSQSGFRDEALQRMDILHAVIKFKISFFPDTYSCYEKAIPPGLRLIPNSRVLEILRRDYAEMRDMFYEESAAPFDEVIAVLGRLEREVNNLRTDPQ